MEKKNSKEVLQAQPSTEVKKGRRNIWLIITVIALIFLLLLSLIGTGFLYYIYTKEKQKNSTLDLQVGSLKKDKDGLNLQNDLLKKENDFYKANWNKPSQQNTNPYDKTILQASGNYIINDSNGRVISESELIDLTPWELKVARNEIYARHGRSFVHKDLACYFAQQGWYKTNPNYSDSLLSNTENQNISTILNYEKKINSPLMNYDSGC